MHQGPQLCGSTNIISMKKYISVISIPVTDQQRSKEFYEKVGFKLLIEAPMGNGETWVQLELENTQTSIALVTWFKQMPPGSVCGWVIETDDIQRELDALKAQDIEASPIDQTPWGKFAWVKDPDGNSFNFRQE